VSPLLESSTETDDRFDDHAVRNLGCSFLNNSDVEEGNFVPYQLTALNENKDRIKVSLILRLGVRFLVGVARNERIDATPNFRA
jgi:hypothetical protein